MTSHYIDGSKFNDQGLIEPLLDCLLALQVGLLYLHLPLYLSLSLSLYQFELRSLC